MNKESELTNSHREKSSGRRIFLVDGHSYLYRAFHATPYMSNSKGLPTNTTYAFISMLKKLLNEEKPDTLIVIFDSKSPSFREEISKEYKAQRPPMPDNLSVQIPYVKMIIEAMGIPVLEQAGFEADDIIGTITEKFRQEDVYIYIVTGDKDMMQLVSERVFIRDTMKNLLISKNEVVEKFGVEPSFIKDYLALCGDASDNIPGVPGIGGKTAKELINNIGSVEEIYEHIEKISKASVKAKLVAAKELAFMSKDLATIRMDVPIGRDVEDLIQGQENPDAFRKIYRELEFTSLYRAIKSDNEEKKSAQKKELASLNKKNVSIVTNFQGKAPHNIHLEGFAVFDNEGVYFSKNEEELIYIIDSAEEIVVHNIKPILLFLLHKNETLNTIPPPHRPDLHIRKFFDTMLASYILNPLRKDYGINAIVEEYLGSEISSQNDRDNITESVQYLFDLKNILNEKIEKSDLGNLFYTIETPLVEVLAFMEYAGVKIDRKMLVELSIDFNKRLTAIMKKIYSLSEEPFNINSSQQLSRILFEKLQLTPVKKTKTGYSTDVEVLEKLSAVHALPREILVYRTLTKLKNTYIDVLPGLINPHTGRVHASFNQMIVATGRLSSSDPNLQNIPARGEEGRKIREAFVPEEGFILLSSDYSQIELRVLAHISKDELLTEAFLNNEDIHSNVAKEVFGVKTEEVTQDMRRAAKVINFGIIYGMSAFGLSKELGIMQRDAQNYIDEYFLKYNGVKTYMETVLEETRSRGFVRTLLGRIRYIPEINNRDSTIRQLGERTAMNTPIQGTAADIIKMAMVNIHRKIKENNLVSRLIMQIHDELVFEVQYDDLAEMEKMVKHEMEHVIALDVPLKVSLCSGRNWAEAHG